MTLRPFPRRVIKKGEADRLVVELVQQRLNARGCGPIDADGEFDKETQSAVKLFQARFPDVEGAPLVVDGKVGPITWAALFGEEDASVLHGADAPLFERAVEIAQSQVGVMEQPPGSNRGPRVDQYIRRVGLDPTGNVAWCAAFVYFCFDEAASGLGRPNPVIKTARVLDHWKKAGETGVRRIAGTKAAQNPELVKPGHIFIIDTGEPGGGGHTGIVLDVFGGKLVTIEGNTNDAGSAEGIGVFRRVSRKIAQINKGFIDYAST